MSLEDRISSIKKVISTGDVYACTMAARDCLLIIEVAFRELLRRHANKLLTPDREKLEKSINNMVKGSRATGIKDFTLGQLVGVLRESNFFESWSKATGKPLKSIHWMNLGNINNDRNEWLTHVATLKELLDSESQVTSSEANFLLSYLNIIIETFGIDSLENLSVFELELPEGQVSLNSPFYVERPPIEKDCFESILKPYALIRVKAPRQMGKTSLMSRILDHAQKNGHRTVSITFQEADSVIFKKLDDLLRWFCASVAMRLNLADELEKRWKGVVGSKSKCSNYFRDYVLPNANTPLTLGLDEVDQVFQYPEVMQDFFGLLRAWHEISKNDETWKKLRLILVHSQEVYVPLNINQSPFNVGLPIELLELTESQAIELAQRHKLECSEKEIAQLMALVGGHPYLLRVAFYAIARKNITLEKLNDTAATHGGLYFEHLHRHDVNLQESKLAEIMREIAVADKPFEGIDSTKAFKLRSMGLIKFEKNAVVPFCGLYRQYFKQRTKF